MITATHTIHIERPVHEVFEYLCDHENRIHWQGNLTEHEHERIGKGSRITEVRNVLGRRVEIKGQITEFEDDRKLTFSGQGPAVKKLEYHYQLTSQRNGTQLDTEVDIELAEMFGLAQGVIKRLTERELDHAHTTLKDILENQDAHEQVKQLPTHRHHARSKA